VHGVTDHGLNEDEVIARIKTTTFRQQINRSVLDIGVTTADSDAKAIMPRLTTCVFSKAEKWGRFL